VIVAGYREHDEWEKLVANACARDPRVLAEVSKTSRKVATLASTTVRTATATGRGAELKQRVAVSIKVKNGIKVFPRKQTEPINSEIPVALVVSDAWPSKLFEYGSGRGRTFPATHFMAIAMRAARKRGWYMRTVRGGAR
jgi:hypothetical protein